MLVTVAVACRSRSQDPWQQYASAEGGFTVQLPTQPFTHIDATVHRKEDVQAHLENRKVWIQRNKNYRAMKKFRGRE